MPNLIRPVDRQLLAPFLDYCSRYGARHDESFVPGAGFEPGPNEPAHVLLDEAGTVCGASALLLGASWGRSGRGRFSIIHAGGDEGGTIHDYRSLVAAAARSAEGRVAELYLFLPETAAASVEALESLGFARERIVYGMEAPIDGALVATPPQGWRLDPVAADDAHAIGEFATVRNRNFKEVLGAHDASTEDVLEMLRSDTALPGGLLLLRDRNGTAHGTLFLDRDDDEGVLFVGAVTVDREVRGQGLGRFLVRSALTFGAERGFTKAFLSVNALNRSALSLYEGEGFVQERAMVCLAASVDALASLG